MNLETQSKMQFEQKRIFNIAKGHAEEAAQLERQKQWGAASRKWKAAASYYNDSYCRSWHNADWCEKREAFCKMMSRGGLGSKECN